MIATLFISFVVMLALAVPIAFALILASAGAMAGYTPYSMEVISQKLYGMSNSFQLLAIPLFIFAGGLMSRGGMSDRLIRLASALVGNLRGGLGIVAILACMLFAAVSGSTAATTAAVGVVMMPPLMRSGFSRAAVTSLHATAGSIGIIIPPSIPLVLMGVIAQISIGELFLGGVLPGVAVGGALMLITHLIARWQGHEPSGGRPGIRELAVAFKESVLSLLTVLFVLGGITWGWVTPTEAAIIAVAWAALVCLTIYRTLSVRDLYEALVDTGKINGIVVFCIGATAPFAWLLTIEQVPDQIVSGLFALTDSHVVLILIMVAVLLLVGTFIDLTPAMLLLVPIFQPVAEQIGMDMVHFGVLVVMALGIGQCTPPVGIGLFVACSISRTSVVKTTPALLPFLGAMLTALLLVAFWQPLTTWLPDLLMN